MLASTDDSPARHRDGTAHKPRAARRSPMPAVAVALAALGAAYAAVALSSISEAYVDFGDGNYLYIASRLLEGKALYRDILSPQPPLHVCVGAALLWVGRLAGEPLTAVRVFSILLHLLTMAIVARLAWRLFGGQPSDDRPPDRLGPTAAVAAAALYLLAPIGFWWTLCFESEPFEMAFLLASTLWFLDLKPRSMVCLLYTSDAADE